MKKIFFSFAAIALFFVSCTTDDSIFDGPSLNDIYGEFAILDSLNISNSAVDFSSGQTIHCTAEFSKNVNWKIEITGGESGAIYSVEGFSRIIDATNSLWDGSATTLPMFRAENCTVQLTITGEVDTLSGSVEILGAKDISGFILSDFEDVINPGWAPFVQSGADMSFFITDATIAAQGTKYYDMGGEVNWDWLIGLIDIPATAYGAATFPLSSNPNNVYFNVMLSKIPSISNAIVLFQFKEDDNGDGTYTAGTEDLFSLEVKLTENDGWKLYSIKYSDLPTLNNGVPADPYGNGIYEPEKLQMVSVLMLANPTSGYSQALMDLMVFTENAPFKP
ncbi:MAG: hypothetical protein ACKVPJ_10000 [Chitinophagales bacterium]